MSFFYSSPGLLDELSEDGKRNWHKHVLSNMKSSAGPPQDSHGHFYQNGGTRNQFFIEALDGLASDAVSEEIGWTAFPRPIEIDSASDEERWNTADGDRARSQIEYCEWSVDKNDDGSIRRISFTCEDRFYWQTLWNDNPSLVVNLYKKYISPNVTKDDLQNNQGQYIPDNKWNHSAKSGAMHMISGPNTIAAAIELVAAASVTRLDSSGQPITSARRITRCGGFADHSRHSDPSIYESVNTLARSGHFISMQNAPELSFEKVIFDGWSAPDGSDPSTYWSYTRGEDDHFQRGELFVPDGKGFSISDLKIDGENIRYGAQIADKIRIKVIGVAHKLGSANISPVAGCLAPPLEHVPNENMSVIPLSRVL